VAAAFALVLSTGTAAMATYALRPDLNVNANGISNSITIPGTLTGGAARTTPVEFTVTGNDSSYPTTSWTVTGASTSTSQVSGASMSAVTVSSNGSVSTGQIDWTTPAATTSDTTYTLTVGFTASGAADINDTGTNRQVNITFTVAGVPAPSDSTPPVIDYVLNPASPDGANGWYVSDVTLTWTVTEDESPGSLQKIGCVGQNITADQQETTYSCSATSDGGSATQVDVKIKRDATAPTITDAGFPFGTSGNNGWYKSAVTESFTASDATSGLTDCTSSFTKDSGTAEGSAVTIASGTCSDNAGNTGTSVDSPAYKIDLSDPTNVAFVGGPADGGSYYFGSVPAAPTCTADDAVSGLDSCAVSGYSSAVGSHTLRATATDKAGRTATATSSYTVLAWTLNGFYAPVDMNGVYNTVKGGSTVPLKFEMFAGATELTDTADVASFTTQKITCSGDPIVDAIEVTSTGGTSLRYDTTGGQFIQNWKTPTGAGICYKATMTALDGSSITAYFKTK
jgi:hypothetical protein